MLYGPQIARKRPKIGIMGILNQLRAKVQAVSDGMESGELIRNVVVRHPDDILELQKVQLFEGKASSGEDIRPYYSEDLKPFGYFKNEESAKRYSVWKETGISYPYSAQRNPDAPNLYINGRFHDELGVQFDIASVGIVGTTEYSQRIINKYGSQTFGLTWPNWNEIFAERGALAELMDELKTMLYGN